MATKSRGHGEGGVRQRADGTCEATVSYGTKTGKDGKARRDRKFFYGKTRAEAVAKQKAALSDQRLGKPTPDARLTVARYLTTWIAAQRPRALKPSTYRSYEQTVRLYLIPSLGHLRLAKLTPQDVQAFLDRMRVERTRRGTPYSARAIGLMRDVLRKALTDAQAQDLLARNVAELAKPPRGKARKGVALTKEQVRTLLAAIKGDRLETLYRLTLALGLRQGEVLGLTWSDVDLDQRTLTIRDAVQRVKDDAVGKSRLAAVGTKSESSTRTIKLPPFLIALLREHREAQQREHEAQQARERGREERGERIVRRWCDKQMVFCTRYGAPFDGPNVTTYFQAHLARAGLPPMRFHDLRHSAVSFMAAEGVPVEVARAILGHADSRTTMNVYRHVLDEEHESAAQVIERIHGAA